MRWVTLSVALAAVILAARPALAQSPTLPKWDAGASFLCCSAMAGTPTSMTMANPTPPITSSSADSGPPT